MNDRWDLSYLYKGFEDETFRRDLGSLEEEAKKLAEEKGYVMKEEP